MATTSLGYKINKHPIAQSFFVDATSGIYVTKIDLFFAAKDNSFPVNLQLRPMVNGLPSANEIIPGSQVVVAGRGPRRADCSAPTAAAALRLTRQGCHHFSKTVIRG